MKKMFTKIVSTALLITLAVLCFAVKAQNITATVPVAKVDSTTATVAENKTEVKKEKPDADAKAEAKADEKVAKKAAEADTVWHPQRRLWGYAFGDEYYDAHADATNRGPETMYNGVPTYRNAFQFRRMYLGYDYEISKKFKAEVLLASEPNANTGVVSATSTSTTTVTGATGLLLKPLPLPPLLLPMVIIWLTEKWRLDKEL